MLCPLRGLAGSNAASWTARAGSRDGGADWQPGIPSGGYDLKVMMQGSGQAIARWSPLTDADSACWRIPSRSSACGGHAVAKGAFLLLASDYRGWVRRDFSLDWNGPDRYDDAPCRHPG